MSRRADIAAKIDLFAEVKRLREENARLEAAVLQHAASADHARQELRGVSQTLFTTERKLGETRALLEKLKVAAMKVPVIRAADGNTGWVCLGCGAMSGIGVDQDCKPDCWTAALENALPGALP